MDKVGGGCGTSVRSARGQAQGVRSEAVAGALIQRLRRDKVCGGGEGDRHRV